MTQFIYTVHYIKWRNHYFVAYVVHTGNKKVLRKIAEETDTSINNEYFCP